MFFLFHRAILWDLFLSKHILQHFLAAPQIRGCKKNISIARLFRFLFNVEIFIKLWACQGSGFEAARGLIASKTFKNTNSGISHPRSTLDVIWLHRYYTTRPALPRCVPRGEQAALFEAWRGRVAANSPMRPMTPTPAPLYLA